MGRRRRTQKSPGPAGTGMAPSRTCSAPGTGRSSRLSVASPHGAWTRSAAAQCTRGRDAQRPVERRRQVDLRARRLRERGRREQPGDPAAARRPSGRRRRRRPTPRAPGSSPVSSIAMRTGTRSRTSRSARDAVDRLLDELEPGGGERLDRADRLLDVPGAVRVEPQLELRAAGGAGGGDAARVVAHADLELHAGEAGPRGLRARGRGASRGRSASTVAFTGTASSGSFVSSSATGRPACLPARSQSARSMAASAWGRSAGGAAGVEHGDALRLGPERRDGRRRRRRARRGPPRRSRRRRAPAAPPRRARSTSSSPCSRTSKSVRSRSTRVGRRAAATGTRPAALLDGQDHEMRMPAVSSTQNTSCRPAVRASAPLSVGPSTRVRTTPTSLTASGTVSHGSSHHSALQEPSRRSRSRRSAEHQEADRHERRVLEARALAPEPHRQRPLARAPVGVHVADVVHDEDRRRRAGRPGRRARRTPTASDSSCAKAEPATATMPKKRNTKTSPRPS